MNKMYLIIKTDRSSKMNYIKIYQYYEDALGQVGIIKYKIMKIGQDRKEWNEIELNIIE